MIRGRVLITGGSGFVGRHLVEGARLQGIRFSVAEGDLRRPDIAEAAVERARPAAVVHLAWLPPSSSSTIWQALIENLRMAWNLLAAVRRVSPGATVLIPGSAAQYGMASRELLREDAPTRPVSAYGALKCALEAACLRSRGLRLAPRARFVPGTSA